MSASSRSGRNPSTLAALAAFLALAAAAEILRAAPASTMTPLERAYATFYGAGASVLAGAALLTLALAYASRSPWAPRAGLALAGFALALVALGLAMPDAVFAFSVRRAEFTADAQPLGRVWLAARWASLAALAVVGARVARRSLDARAVGERALAAGLALVAVVDLLSLEGALRIVGLLAAAGALAFALAKGA